jgi:hypothetical protein
LIESFFVVSAAIVVSADIVEAVSVEAVESVTVVDVSVDSVLELEQEVARAIIDSRKNAYLAMFFRELDELKLYVFNPNNGKK